MKINKYLCLITFLLFFTNSIFSQFEEIDIRNLDLPDDEFLIDKDLYLFRPTDPCFCEGEDFNFWGDTGFGGSNFAALNAGLMIEAQRRTALENWYVRQRGLVKDEIEEHYNQTFDNHNNFNANFKEAVDKVFIDFGKSDYNYFDWNVSSLKSNHINTNIQYKARNKVNVRELHHLNYRKQEILDGNIHNSIFTFSEIYGGIKLRDITDVNGINTNWNIIKGFLDTNLPTEQNAKYHSDELGNLDGKFDNFMLGLQRSFYDNNLNPGQRLFLEQFSINLLKAYRANPNAFGPPNAPLNLNLPDNLGAGLSIPTGNQSVLQSYLWGYSERSVFDPNYYLKVLDEILVNNGFQPVYGDVTRLNWLIRNAYVNIAKAQAIDRRNSAFNDLISSSTTEDILIDLFITALGERNNAFLDARPALREEIEKYFKANNRSQNSHDAINYLLNQYQDENPFLVDTSVYFSPIDLLIGDIDDLSRAIEFCSYGEGDIKGLPHFGNVLAAFFETEDDNNFKGFIIREMFKGKGIHVPSQNVVPNSWYGENFKFANQNNGCIRIEFFNEDINNTPPDCQTDDYENAIRVGAIVFSKKYGWVDTSHAFRDAIRTNPFVGVENLWRQLKDPPTASQISQGYYSVNYKQDILIFGISIGIERQYLVKPGLNLEQRKSVALAIFQDVSIAFESLQSLHPTSTSSFEPADLPSNMLRFYKVVEEFTEQQIRNAIETVSVDQSLEVFRLYPCTFVDKKYKNKTFKPVRFESPYTSGNFGVPDIFNTIQPFEIKQANDFGNGDLILWEQDIISN